MENILITTSSFGKEDPTPIDSIKEAGYNVVLNPYQRRLKYEEVLELIIKYDPVGIIAGLEPLNSEHLGKAKKLKVISRCGVGIDNVDLYAADRNNILVVNTPHAPCKAVAELTATLILACIKRVFEANSNMKKGDWKRPMGRLISGKTLGIFGCGRIGSAVAQLLSSFDVKLLGFDPYLTKHTATKLVKKDEIIEKSDIITLHLPFSESNKYVVDEAFLQNMKPGSILVNTARGGLVDEKALYYSLASGHLGGACLDTFEQEPYSGELRCLDNVILTPHIGSYTLETRVDMEKEATINLLDALKL